MRIADDIAGGLKEDNHVLINVLSASGTTAAAHCSTDAVLENTFLQFSFGFLNVLIFLINMLKKRRNA